MCVRVCMDVRVGVCDVCVRLYGCVRVCVYTCVCVAGSASVSERGAAGVSGLCVLRSLNGLRFVPE